MTIEQFDKTRFTFNMRFLYKGKEYPIFSVDFEERLVGINENNQEVIDIAKQAYSMGRSNYTIKAFNASFKQFKKK